MALTAPPVEPPRASWWGVAAVFVTIVLSGAVVVSLSDGGDGDRSSRVVTTMILGLAMGALIANLTPVGRLFRRWSAIVAAMLVGLGLAFLLTIVGEVPEGGGMAVLGLLFLVAGLDLCYVSRLRTMVVLSGLCIIPTVAALESSRLFAGFAWFTAAMVALWLLSVDEQRALPRPEPIDGVIGRPRARGADLVRTVAMALLAGFTLTFLLSTPSCSFRPLAKVLEWLPWHPQISPRYVPSLDQPVRLPELDEQGHETIPYLDEKGRRFLVDPTSAEPYALIDRDGATVVVSGGGREVARFEDGGLVVADPAGGSLRYERDDEGWYVDTGAGGRLRVVPRDWAAELRDESGRSVARQRVDSGTVVIEPDPAERRRLAELDPDGDGRIPIPNGAILDATTGNGREGNRVTHRDGYVEIEDDLGEIRTHRAEGGGAVVDIDPGPTSGSAHRYRIDGDHVSVHDDADDRVLQLDVDREGNALEDLRDVDLRDAQPEVDRKRPRPPWRTIGIVVAVLAALAGAIAAGVWWRRRPGQPDQADRDWAEEQVRRLEAWGGDHEVAREPAETVVRYADRLDREIVRDGTVDGVGEVLDGALFGRRPLPVEVRLRTEATIDRLLGAHPKPSRVERRRAR